MSRFGRGLRLAGASFRVVRADPWISLVLLVGMVGMAGVVALSLALFRLVFGHLPTEADLTFPRELLALPTLWAAASVSAYCNVVVAVMADRRLRGEDARVSDGIAVANARLGRILTWTLLSVTVGMVMQLLIERFKLFGWLVSKFVNLAWTMATLFVVPVLALEDVGVRDAIKRSAKAFRAKWGESVVAEGTIGAVSFLVAIPIAVITIAVMTVNLFAGLVVLLVLCAAMAVLTSAVDAVVDVALYRYAVDGTPVDGFRATDLNGAFRAKR